MGCGCGTSGGCGCSATTLHTQQAVVSAPKRAAEWLFSRPGKAEGLDFPADDAPLLAKKPRDLHASARGPGVRVSEHQAARACGAKPSDSASLRVGLPDDVDCGKGLPEGLLMATGSIRPPARRPAGELLEPFGAIEMDPNGNMFYGLGKAMQRALQQDVWARVLLPEPELALRPSRERGCFPDMSGRSATAPELLDLLAQLDRFGRTR